MEPSRDIGRLIEIMAALRDPQTGCPWDKEQTFDTIAPYTVEEAYEVAEAIARSDMIDLRDELGDLLLQVVYHARMAEEDGSFGFDDVVEAITTKMIRRHPHVFGDSEARAAGQAKGMWNAIKAEEKRRRQVARGEDENRKPALLDEVGRGLPPLARAIRLQEKASTVGFDWNDAHAVVKKLREETDEIEAEIDRESQVHARITDEIGDLLFAVANLARHLNVDPEQALAGTNAKFEARFGKVESELAAQGRSPTEAALDEMEALWQKAKRHEAGR